MHIVSREEQVKHKDFHEVIVDLMAESTSKFNF
jgi:hypothetical protein